MSRQSHRSILLWSATALWAVGLAIGLHRLWLYDRTPGPSDHAVAVWPADTALQLDNTRPTLVMALHPQCPCSAASVAELARVVAKVGPQTRVYVLAIVPDGATPQEWDTTSLPARAAQIPGLHLLTDPGGVEAKRFGAQTSGHTTLYSSTGQLLFRGGITESRGHQGDNTGEDALVAAIRGERPTLHHSAVFGCSLFAGGDK